MTNLEISVPDELLRQSWRGDTRRIIEVKQQLRDQLAVIDMLPDALRIIGERLMQRWGAFSRGSNKLNTLSLEKLSERVNEARSETERALHLLEDSPAMSPSEEADYASSSAVRAFLDVIDEVLYIEGDLRRIEHDVSRSIEEVHAVLTRATTT